jgi:flagellar basal-body rod modification protein FlgD
MNVLALSASSPAANGTTGSGTASSSSAASSNELNGNSFITLLTAQLQAQDPFDPTDPTTLLNELVQFNSLQQLIDINSLLAQVLSGSSARAAGGGAPPVASGTQF